MFGRGVCFQVCASHELLTKNERDLLWLVDVAADSPPSQQHQKLLDVEMAACRIPEKHVALAGNRVATILQIHESLIGGSFRAFMKESADSRIGEGGAGR